MSHITIELGTSFYVYFSDFRFGITDRMPEFKLEKKISHGKYKLGRYLTCLPLGQTDPVTSCQLAAR